jgi:hypothetical protein
MSRIARRIIGLFLLTSLGSAGFLYAQFGRFSDGRLRGEQGDLAELPPEQWPDRNVGGCHLHYVSVRREPSGNGWTTDYPWGQRHLLIRLSELTKTHVSWLTPREAPHVWLVQLMDDALFQCPFIMASDIGTIGMSPEEAARLRVYLEKGGFLWVDDFWGNAAWEHWTRELAKALPRSEYPIEDVPPTDPIYRTMFEVEGVPQVTSIRFWRASGGTSTSERGPESAVPHFRAVRDKTGRIMVAMTHNTDVSDSWERETDDPEFFYQFSPRGYAFGINVILYALTH